MRSTIRGTTRRTFFGLAGVALWPHRSPAKPNPSETQAGANEEDYWIMVRRQFSFPEDRVPFNAANLCPSPRVVTERVIELTHDIDHDCSFQSRGKFDSLREQSRNLVAKQLGASPEEIALVRNTSEANNTINNGLDLGAGDQVVIWDQNHPTNNVAWQVRAERRGFRVVEVSTPTAPTDAGELIEAFERALEPSTKVLAVTHVSNLTGVRLPVRELAELAQRKGIWIHVDGAQSWGALDVDLHSLGCDSYSASSHKWFCGPREVGVLYVRQERIAEVWPQGVAPGWGNDPEPDVSGALKFESLGQRDDARLAAVAVAAEFHAALGATAVESRMHALAQRFKDGVQDLDLPLLTPAAPELSAGVCIVSARTDVRREVFQALYERHGLIAAPTGGLRICPHLYNTMEHVDRAIAAVEELREVLLS